MIVLTLDDIIFIALIVLAVILFICGMIGEVIRTWKEVDDEDTNS